MKIYKVMVGTTGNNHVVYYYVSSNTSNSAKIKAMILSDDKPVIEAIRLRWFSEVIVEEISSKIAKRISILSTTILPPRFISLWEEFRLSNKPKLLSCSEWC